MIVWYQCNRKEINVLNTCVESNLSVRPRVFLLKTSAAQWVFLSQSQPKGLKEKADIYVGSTKNTIQKWKKAKLYMHHCTVEIII